MNELRKRMGALRNNNDNNDLTGVWVRGYGKYLKINDVATSDMTLFGVEGGVDVMTNALNGKVYVGVMAGMMDSEDINVTTSKGAGASGWTRTPSVGAYLTWMHKSGSNSKWFVDMTARYFWVHTNIMRDDKANGYDVTRGFWAFSGEVGHLFYMESPNWMNIGTKQHSHLSIEPKMEVRYGVGESMNFTTTDGAKGFVDTTRALSTRLYVQTNFLPNGTVSTWKPFVELGIYNEWSGRTEMQFGGASLDASNTKGFGFEASVGVNATVSESTYVYGAFTLEEGKVYQSYQLNLGIRTKF
jgi:outer membrane autotransporter protein